MQASAPGGLARLSVISHGLGSQAMYHLDTVGVEGCRHTPGWGQPSGAAHRGLPACLPGCPPMPHTPHTPPAQGAANEHVPMNDQGFYLPLWQRVLVRSTFVALCTIVACVVASGWGCGRRQALLGGRQGQGGPCAVVPGLSGFACLLASLPCPLQPFFNAIVGLVGAIT